MEQKGDSKEELIKRSEFLFNKLLALIRGLNKGLIVLAK